jgi:ribosomal small subunit protein bTHX
MPPAGDGNQQSARLPSSFISRTRRGMGKGDRRTRRGKINRSSYGKNRKRKVKKKTKPAARAS